MAYGIIDLFHVKDGDGILFYLGILVIEAIALKFVGTKMVRYNHSLANPNDQQLLSIEEEDSYYEYYSDDDEEEEEKT